MAAVWQQDGEPAAGRPARCLASGRPTVWRRPRWPRRRVLRWLAGCGQRQAIAADRTCSAKLHYVHHVDWTATVTAIGTLLGGLALPLAFIQLAALRQDRLRAQINKVGAWGGDARKGAPG